MNNRGIAPIKALALMLVVGVGIFYMAGGFEGSAQQAAPGEEAMEKGEGPAKKTAPDQEIVSSCGDDQEGKLKIRNLNPENDGSIEYTSHDYYIYQATTDGGWDYVTDGSLTGNSSYAEETLTCGYKYRIDYVAKSDAVSEIRKVDAADGVKLEDDSVIIPSFVSGQLRLKTQSPQKATLEYKLYDDTGNTQYEEATNNNTSYVSEPVTFDESDDTGIDIGTGEALDVQLWTRATNSDEIWYDQGQVLAVKGDLSVWNFEKGGYTLSNGENLGEASLTTPENAQLGDVKKAIKFDSKITKYPKEVFDISIPAASGVDPADGDDITLNLMLRGKFASLNSDTANMIKTGGAKDDTGTYSAVYNIEDIIIDVE